MIDFLKRVAEFTTNNTSCQPHETIIVLPNKRACLFLRNHFTETLKPGQWLPAILTIEEAIELWSGKLIADRLALKLLLIEIFIEQQQQSGHDLKAFIARADEMLNDFEDIDQQMVDAGEIFQYLSEAKAIELWHPDGSPLTIAERKYLSIYQSLSGYYRLFREKLSHGISGYKGMLTKMLAEDYDLEWFKKQNHRFCIFAGFNALTRAEQTLFTNICKHRKAELLWDLDSYYMDQNSYQPSQAGLFHLRFKELHPQLVKNWIGSALIDMPKKIDVISVAGNVSQARALGQLLRNSFKNGEPIPERTAIVLADEKLLIPVLHSIPAEIESFNVTMGLPFRQNAIYQIIEQLSELIDSAVINDIQCFFKKKALTAFFELGIFNGFLSQTKALKTIRKNIKTCSATIIPATMLFDFTTSADATDAGNSILKLMSRQNAEIKKNYIGFIREALGIIGGHVHELSHQAVAQLILAGIDTADKMLNRIEKLLYEHITVQEIISFPQLFRSLSASLNVPFAGEPVKGIQIMGMLETRSLDFDQVFILSANEGILPPASFSHGFISHDIRIAYGLQGRRDQQAVSAYHFFRLLQRPGHVSLFFNSESNVLGGGEKSRYILQIIKELSVLNPALEINEIQMGVSASYPLSAQNISIEKTPDIIELLKQKAKSGFSPTSLSNFILCPLKFFLSEIAYIREFKDPGNDSGLEVLGNIVHEALSEIYQPLVQKKIDAEILIKSTANIRDYVNNAYTKIVKQPVSNEGKTMLIIEAAQHYIRQFIDYEIQSAANSDLAPTIISLEEELSLHLNTSAGLVRIKGTPDRIEIQTNEIHIIDYKTGKLDKSELEVTVWNDLTVNNKKSKALQLAMYILLYLSNHEITKGTTLKGKILGFRSLSNGFMFATFPTTQNEEEINYLKRNIEETLISLIEMIFDTDKAFEQTNNPENCNYCHFRNMCNR